MAVTTKRLSRKNIEDFLVEMKGILLAASFDPEKDFIFRRNERRMSLTTSIPTRIRWLPWTTITRISSRN